MKTLNDTLPRGLSDLSDTLILKLKMDSANDHLTIPLAISSGKELFAALSSDDKNANIRISQVAFLTVLSTGPLAEIFITK